MKPHMIAFATLAFLITESCAPGISLTRVRPAPHNLGAARRVAVLDLVGPPEALGVVWAELSQQIVGGGWFQLYASPPSMHAAPLPVDPALEGVDPPRPAVPAMPVPADLYVVAHVTRWDYDESRSVEKTWENGKEVHRHFRQGQAAIRLGFQLIDAASGRIVYSRELGASEYGLKKEEGQASASPSDLLRRACAAAVGDFLRTVTPRTTVEKMVLDDSEKSLEEGVALCKKGQLAEAMSSFERVIQESHATSAGATYNLGVLFEAQGEYAKAEERYRQAIGLQPKDIYRDALGDLHRRLAEDRALQQPL